MSLKHPDGFTLTEIMIATVLVSLAFAAAASIQVSALKFLKTQQTVDVTTGPESAIEEMAKQISVANNVGTFFGGTQIDLRIDHDLCSNTRAVVTPGNILDDNFYHFRIHNNMVLSLCDSTANSPLNGVGAPPGTVNLTSPSLTTLTGGFTIVNPSGAGQSTVVRINVSASPPAKTIQTEIALGAQAKN